ncbi:MAG: nucleotidyltransferase domain-containing protein [Chloroflexi bacterium]|nr:MAG: nucleotidyltransferase domain-containing protein [Chloroflexota bacterium]
MSIRAVSSPVRETDAPPFPPALGERERSALTDFLNRLERRLPGRVERCTLLGSWARGEGRPGSDPDLLLVADHQAAEFIAVVESLIAPPS